MSNWSRTASNYCSLYSELSETDGETETDDEVEGTWLLHTSLAVTEIRIQLRTRLAALRNANDEPQVDGYSLNA